MNRQSPENSLRQSPGQRVGQPAGQRAGESPDAQELVFTVATTSDIEAVATLVEASFRGEGSNVGWTTETHLVTGPRSTTDEIRAIIDSEHSQLVLGRIDDEVVGCFRLEAVGGATTFFGMFSVHPKLQGLGIGSQLLAEAERTARDGLGAYRMRMHVLSGRPELTAWYVRKGYRPTGDAHPFAEIAHRGDPLTDDLEFLVYEKLLVGSPETEADSGPPRGRD